MGSVLMILAAIAVAAANGANDNFKGVATLFGSRTASYRSSLAWASLTTLAGALAATFFGARLATAFSGDGLLPANLVAMPALLAAVAIGTALTVGIATRARLPVSTTHAVLGALVGAGAVASAGQLNLAALSQRFLAPLLLSPIAAFALVAAVYPLLSRARRAMRVEASTCLCVAVGAEAVSANRLTLGLRPAPAIHVCERHCEGALLGIDARRIVSGAHYLSAGLQSFARGLNDTPKIAALLLGASLAGISITAGFAFVVVAAAMLIGGWFGARRVGETMSHRITPLNDGQALTSNAVTAGLVLAASAFALPVSLTHVSVGGLAGMGWSTGTARWGTLRTIALAWILTLPLAAALGAAMFAIARRIAA